jgi:hypothetical protein
MAVIYDEAADILLYRFFSFLRLLMHVHPRVGAEMYAQYLGLRTSLVSGWNAVELAAGGEVAVRFIHIGKQGGRITEEPPREPKGQIHTIREEDMPPFIGSPAWRQFMQLAEMVASRRPQGIPPAYVQERIDLLNAVADTPLRGGDAQVDHFLSRSFEKIKTEVNGPEGSLLSFSDPVDRAIVGCLSFRLTSRQAYNIIAVLLTYYAIRYPSPLDQIHPIQIVQKQIEHLISFVSRIKKERHAYDLGAYSQLTYLGLLLANTALLMANQLARRSPTPKIATWFERRGLFVEELAAHWLAPCLLHPASLAPFGPVEYQRAAEVGILNSRGLYAGAGRIGKDSFAPDEVWPRIQAYSSAGQRLGANYAPYDDPLHPALKEHLATFLLAMKLGQSGTSDR